jgi:hypothetical protein
MSVAAQELSDADIANLAAYYSGIQIDVIPLSASDNSWAATDITSFLRVPLRNSVSALTR